MLARWQATITDESGNVVPNAQIDVFRESDGARPQLYDDRDGESAIGNPFNADGEGFAFFHAPGSAYRIVASVPGFSREWRYVGVGTANESDAGFNQAEFIEYDNTESGLSAENVQAAIDELSGITDQVNNWTAAQTSQIIALTDTAGTVAPDFAAGHHFTLLLEDDYQINNPDNKPGSSISQAGILELTQDGSGGHEPTWGGSWVNADGDPPDAPDATAGTTTVYSWIKLGNGDILTNVIGVLS